ncbi:unnamed protein product, partial [Ectocarpus sp. 8 AP-2014]
AELGGGGRSTSILRRWLMPEAMNCPRRGCFCSASSVVLCSRFSPTSSKTLESWFLSLGHDPSRSNLVSQTSLFLSPPSIGPSKYVYTRVGAILNRICVESRSARQCRACQYNQLCF